MKHTKKRISRFLSVLTLLTALVLLASSCSAGGNHAIAMEDHAPYYNCETSSYDGAYPESMSGADDYLKDSSPAELTDEEKKQIDDTQKIIRTGAMELETKEFDRALAHIEASAMGLGGYIESSDVRDASKTYRNRVYARSASYVVRIPAESFEAYMDGLASEFHVLYKTTSATDVTESYMDVQARLNSLKTQEERLLAMLEKADDLEYLLRLNDELSDVRYEIEGYTARLNRLEKQVAYSTLKVVLTEVVEYTEISEEPHSFGERFVSAVSESLSDFGDGVQDFVIWLVYALPGLLVFAVIVLVIVLLIRRAVRKNREKAALRRQEEAQRRAAVKAEQNVRNQSKPEDREN